MDQGLRLRKASLTVYEVEHIPTPQIHPGGAERVAPRRLRWRDGAPGPATACMVGCLQARLSEVRRDWVGRGRCWTSPRYLGSGFPCARFGVVPKLLRLPRPRCPTQSLRTSLDPHPIDGELRIQARTSCLAELCFVRINPFPLSEHASSCEEDVERPSCSLSTISHISRLNGLWKASFAPV